MLDQSGRRLRFYDDLIRGRAVLLNVFFTACGDTCPLVTQNLREVQDLLGERMGRDIFMISVSLQPELETPAILRDYAETWEVRPGWSFVTGAPGGHRAPATGHGLRRQRSRASPAIGTATPAWFATATTGSTAGPERPGLGRPAWIAKAVTSLADMG